MALPVVDASAVMQRAIRHTNAPHPELEAELQQEHAKIVPKVETKTEQQVNGHPSVSATSQRLATRPERHAPISSDADRVHLHTNGCTSSASHIPHNRKAGFEQGIVESGILRSLHDAAPSYVPQEQQDGPANSVERRVSKASSPRRCQSLGEAPDNSQGGGGGGTETTSRTCNHTLG